MPIGCFPVGMVRPEAGKDLLGRNTRPGIVESRVHRPAQFRAALGERRFLILQQPQARPQDLARVAKTAALQLVLHEAVEVLPKADI